MVVSNKVVYSTEVVAWILYPCVIQLMDPFQTNEKIERTHAVINVHTHDKIRKICYIGLQLNMKRLLNDTRCSPTEKF